MSFQHKTNKFFVVETYLKANIRLTKRIREERIIKTESERGKEMQGWMGQEWRE